MFVRQGSQTQIALGCIICISAALVFALQWPYATFRDNALGILSHCQLTGTLFSAMMYKLGKNAELAYDKTASGWLLIGLNGTVFLIMLGWVAFEVLVDEGPSLRSRERQFLAQASFLLSGGSIRGRFMADGATVEEHVEEKRRASTMALQMSTITANTGGGVSAVGSGGGEVGGGRKLTSSSSASIDMTEMYGRASSSGPLAFTDNPMSGIKGARGGGGGEGAGRKPQEGEGSKSNLLGGLRLAGSTASLGGSGSGGSRRNFFRWEGPGKPTQSLDKVKESLSGSSLGSGAAGGVGKGDPPGGRGSEDRRSLDGAPEGWCREFDEDSQCYYYWNLETGETTWEPPPAETKGMV